MPAYLVSVIAAIKTSSMQSNEEELSTPLSQDSTFTYVNDDQEEEIRFEETTMSEASPTASAPPGGATKYSPAKPVMGGILKTSEDTPWTGGTPKPNWAGLVNPVGPKTACQLRPQSGKSAIYSYSERIKGLKEPLTSILGIDAFKRSVSQHLTRYGMDTIAYLPDPHDPSKCIHIIDGSTRFTVDSCEKSAAIQAQLYDQYDKENDASTVEFLVASLLKNELRASSIAVESSTTRHMETSWTHSQWCGST